MTNRTMNDVLRERLVDAREAAHCLNLQMYLLTHPKERDRLQPPPYPEHKQQRYKQDKLIVWTESQQAVATTSSQEVVDA